MGKKKLIRNNVLILTSFMIGFFSCTVLFAAEKFTIRVIAQNANIRLKPDINSLVIAKVPIGTLLESEGRDDSWYKVNLPPDEKGFIVSGYIHQNIVEVIEEPSEEIKEDIKETKEKKKVELESPEKEIPSSIQKTPPKEEKSPPIYRQRPPRRRERATQKRFFPKIGLGIALPSGDLADLFTIGLGSNISGAFLILKEPQISLISGLEAHYFLNKSGYSDVSMSRLILYTDFSIGKKVNNFGFFAEGGIGLYLDLLEVGVYWWSTSDSEFEVGGRAGGGLNIGRFEILGLYHFVERNMFTIMFSYVF